MDQHGLSLVPASSPAGPAARCKYINVLYGPFHPRNFGGVAFFKGKGQLFHSNG